MKNVQMGNKARDKVTGFEGIVIGRCEYLYGCTQWGISPFAKDGEIKAVNWFDEGRIEFVDDGVSPAAVRTAVNGPGDAPTLGHGRR